MGKKTNLEMSPYNKAMFRDKNEGDNIDEVEIVEETGKSPPARLREKTEDEDKKPATKEKRPVASLKG